jgi:hypothetical protein
MVVLLVVGRGQIQERLHHLLLALPVLSHSRPELGGAVVQHLHCDVVDGPLVYCSHVLSVVRDALVDSRGRRLPHPLGDLPQGGPVLGMQVPQPGQRSIREFGSLRCPSSFGGEPSHLSHGLLLHPAELLGMGRGLGGHGLAQSGLALAGAHDFGGHEFHVRHRGLGAVRGLTQFYLLELGVALPLLHLVMGLLDTPEL